MVSNITDEQLFDLCNRLDGYKDVAKATGMAYQTVKNRMSGIRKRVFSEESVCPEVSEAIHDSIKNDDSKVRRYVITSAQNATPLFEPFFKSLESYCYINNAKLMIIPIRYSNPTSVWSAASEDAEWWATPTIPFLCDKRIKLEQNVMIMGDIKTIPTAVRPLSGFDDFTDHNSAVFGHNRLEFKSIATPSGEHPKFLMTTGTVTEQNYTDSKAGKRGENAHCYGATLLEIDEDGRVFFRQLLSDDRGCFIDRDKEYNPCGAIEADRALGLVTGDTHSLFADMDVIRATHTNEDSIVNQLKPRSVVWHDLHDHFSRNHHHRGQFLLNYAKHHSKFDNVKDELIKTFELLDSCVPTFETKNIVVRSNHDEALDRWLNEADFKLDPENAEFYLETMLACVKAMDYSKGRPKTVDPLAYWGKRLMKNDRTTFLKRDQSYMIGKVECGYHGDKGPDGAFASVLNMNKLGVDVCFGHGHSCFRYGNTTRVGISCQMEMGYNKGASSWSHTHNIIYANNMSSLITVVDGKWYA